MLQVPWTVHNVEKYLRKHNKELVKIPGDGFCLLQAVSTCLLQDHNIVVTVEEMKEYLTLYCIDNVDTYTAFLDREGEWGDQFNI